MLHPISFVAEAVGVVVVDGDLVEEEAVEAVGMNQGNVEVVVGETMINI
ncbi:hypothetical protein KDK_05450 [Dictyobacter kobayashii]|uniref:Uncharacterized protein n=1 Tax=Dictyobacter kobayashii TaxID=2014872 RepID=A0A402ACC7_9CHLR|nr:hypothetical protein KDK_05450 [Dictyobacter kobayashii]